MPNENVSTESGQYHADDASQRRWLVRGVPVAHTPRGRLATPGEVRALFGACLQNRTATDPRWWPDLLAGG